VIVSRNYYTFEDDWEDATIYTEYYEQPAKDVVIYHIMTWWYKLLDIKPLKLWICNYASKRSELPRDCGLEHDHANEPDVCWICPCTSRDLKIYNYEKKNGVKLNEI
jgi:hypothetical protein